MKIYQGSSFTLAKEIFNENIDGSIVEFEGYVVAYNKLIDILDKPIKLALLYGKPGTGKTFLLKKVYKDLSKKQPIIFIAMPFFQESEFVRYLYKNSFSHVDKNIKTFDEFFQLLNNVQKDISTPITVLVDEAQLYPAQIIEKIRILADTRKYKFIFTVHKTDEQEDVFAKDYFKTRIWESIELKNISYNETILYIQKKLLQRNMFDFVKRLSKKQYKLIYQYSKGNLREINKLLYKLFEICEYYENVQPDKIGSNSIAQKYFDMMAISLGYIDA